MEHRGLLGKVSKEAVTEKVTSKQTPEGGEGGRAVQIREIAGAKALWSGGAKALWPGGAQTKWC